VQQLVKLYAVCVSTPNRSCLTLYDVISYNDITSAISSYEYVRNIGAYVFLVYRFWKVFHFNISSCKTFWTPLVPVGLPQSITASRGRCRSDMAPKHSPSQVKTFEASLPIMLTNISSIGHQGARTASVIVGLCRNGVCCLLAHIVTHIVSFMLAVSRVVYTMSSLIKDGGVLARKVLS